MDFLSKEKIFDKVMHKRRLEEEGSSPSPLYIYIYMIYRGYIYFYICDIQRIYIYFYICAIEVRQHWELLKRREQTLVGRSISTEGKQLHISIKMNPHTTVIYS